jgi:hypothetical protein
MIFYEMLAEQKKDIGNSQLMDHASEPPSQIMNDENKDTMNMAQQNPPANEKGQYIAAYGLDHMMDMNEYRKKQRASVHQ